MAGGEDLAEVASSGSSRRPDHGVAGHHDVAQRPVGEADHPLEQLALGFVEHAGSVPSAIIALTSSSVTALGGSPRTREEPEHGLGGDAQEPDDGRADGGEDPPSGRRRGGDALGVAQRQPLGTSSPMISET